MTPEQNDALETRRRLVAKVLETYEDDMAQRPIDLKKYREIKRLAEKLPGGPPEKKKGRWWKFGHE